MPSGACSAWALSRRPGAAVLPPWRAARAGGVPLPSLAGVPHLIIIVAAGLLLGAAPARADEAAEGGPPPVLAQTSEGSLEEAIAGAEAVPTDPPADPVDPPCAPAAGERLDGPAPRALDVDGFLDLRYRYRTTDGGLDPRDDQDTYDTLYLSARGFDDRVAVRFLGRLDADIDGRHRHAGDTFNSLDDTFEENVHGWLYKAYVDLQRIGPLRRFRVGRQALEAELPIRFDGGLAEVNVGRVGAIAYGGVPVRLTEETPYGDWVAGGALTYGLPRLRLRFDYVHLEDRQSASNRHDDDLFQLSATALVVEQLRLHARVASFEGKSQLVVGRILYRNAAYDLAASLGTDLRFGTFRDLSIEFSPFDEIIGRLADYWQVSAQVTKGIGEHVSVMAGAWARELMDDRREGPYNHELQRYYTTVDVRDVGLPDLTISGTGGFYVDGGSHILDLGGEVSKKVGGVTLRLGTSYLLYQVTDVTLEERERVRTVYARLDWAPRLAEEGEWQHPFNFRLGYRAEWDDEEMYHVLDVAIRLVF